MKKFTKNDFVDANILKDDEIIQFENHFLQMKTYDSTYGCCEHCFFFNRNHSCKDINVCCSIYFEADKYGNKSIDYDIIFRKISEIEMLVLTGGQNERIY